MIDDDHTGDLFGEEPPKKPTPREIGNAHRDDGIERTVEHAEAVVDDWAAKAYSFLLSHIKPGVPFNCPMMRLTAAEEGFQMPPDQHAWGGPMQRLVKQGIIVRAGFTLYGDEKSNTSHVAMWVKPLPS